jgi:trans-AT polyketide synthase/acyltransferase/oxidoreductase domain-containing protein
MGAAFLVTGAINQLARKLATCDQVRKVLAEAIYSDVTMCPAADMLKDRAPSPSPITVAPF